MVKFHWLIYMVMLKCARVNGELWQSDLTNSLVVGVENVPNYLLVCWHLAKMRNTINTLCLLYKVFKTNVMCGTWNRLKGNDQEPIQSNSTSCPKHQRGKGHPQDGTKTKTAQAKSQEDSSFEQREKKESRAYDELLQVKWPKEVEPLLYLLIELIQNPNVLPDKTFSIKFSSKQQQYLFSVCARFHFCWFIFCRDLQTWLNVLFRSLSLVPGYFWKFQHILKDNKLCLISVRTW